MAVWLLLRRWPGNSEPGTTQTVSREAARRIVAIEAHLERTDEFTKSLAIQLEDLVKEHVHNAVRESLVVALRELRPTEQKPASDMQRLLGALEMLVGPKPPSKSFSERLQGYLGISIATVAAASGLVALLSSLGVWRAQHPPEILAFAATHPGVRPGASVDLVVDAKDPNGQALQFEYSTSEGRVEGTGPRARLLAPRDAASHSVAVTVKVSNGSSAVAQRTLAVAVRPLPVGSIVFASDIVAGKSVEVHADVACDDPEDLHFTWQADVGSFQPETGSSVFYRAPAVSPSIVTVACGVADDVGSVTISKAVVVTRSQGYVAAPVAQP